MIPGRPAVDYETLVPYGLPADDEYRRWWTSVTPIHELLELGVASQISPPPVEIAALA